MKNKALSFFLMLNSLSAITYTLTVNIPGDNSFSSGGYGAFNPPIAPTYSQNNYDLRGALTTINSISSAENDAFNIIYTATDSEIKLKADLPVIGSGIGSNTTISRTYNLYPTTVSQMTINGMGYQGVQITEPLRPCYISIKNVDLTQCQGALSLYPGSGNCVVENCNIFNNNFLNPVSFPSYVAELIFKGNVSVDDNPLNTQIAMNCLGPFTLNQVASNEEVLIGQKASIGNSLSTSIAVVTKKGSGAAKLQYNSDFDTEDNNSSYFYNGLIVESGSFILDGQGRVASDTQYPVPNLAIGKIPSNTISAIIKNGATFGGCGTWRIASFFAEPYTDGVAEFETDAILAVSSGALFVGGKVIANQYTTLKSKIEPTIAPTLFFYSGGIYKPDLVTAGLDNVNLELELPSNLGNQPAIYTLIYTKDQENLPYFNSVLINGSQGEVIPTPKDSPKAYVYPVNIPTGISTATLYFGSQSLETTVLSDPCAGIIVLSLGATQAALDAFATNQAYLSIQALGSSIATLNNQIKSSKSSQTASGGGNVASFFEMRDLLTQDQSMEPSSKKKETPLYSLSINGFGQFQSQNSVTTQNNYFSAYKTDSSGVILGFDYLGLKDILVGGAATYVYTTLQQAQNTGSQQIHSALGTFYSTFLFDKITFNLLVTGGYNRNFSVRNFSPFVPTPVVFEVLPPEPDGDDYTIVFQGTTIPGGTGRAKYNSYQLTPHFDLNYEIRFGNVSLVPFIQSDCNISFQDMFSEYGAGGFSVPGCGTVLAFDQQIDSLIAFLLQNEAGFNLYEQVDLKKSGLFVFRQKVSYVNRYTIPYLLYSRQVGDPVYTASKIAYPMQDFFGSALEVVYRNKNTSFILTYEGLIGSGFMSNAGFARISQDF